MTRPMPGPPDWYDIDWHPLWGMVWIKNGDECDETFSHAELDEKRLTMEGCAAHYHQAETRYWTAQTMGWTPHRYAFEASVLDRFANTQHALEES